MDALPAYLGGFLAVLLLTSFVKIFTALSIMRTGLGLSGAGFGAVVFGFSLAMSFMILDPQMESLGGWDAFFAGKLSQDNAKLTEQFRPFIEKHTDPGIKVRFEQIASKLKESSVHPAAGAPAQNGQQAQKHPGQAPPGQASFSTELAAFLVSELSEAFKLGFLFIIPFLVIDLVVANALLSLGVTQMPQAVVSLPLKILLFYAVNGWSLVAGKLLSSYL